MNVFAVGGRTLRRAASILPGLAAVFLGGLFRLEAAPKPKDPPRPGAKASEAAKSDRPEKGERAVVYDDRYRPPAKDLLLSPVNERLAESYALFMKGVMSEEAGEPDKALPLYLKALAADPANVGLAMKVSSEFVRRGDTSEAVELLKDTIKAAPKDPSPQLALAFIQLKSLRKPDLALKTAESALALDPNNFLAYAYTAEALDQLGQKEKVTGLLGRAAKATSRDPKFWVRLGDLHRQLLLKDDAKKAPKEALERTTAMYDKALALAGDDLDLLNQVATFHVFAGQIPQAIPLYLKILALSPNHPSVREKLAYSYLQSDQRAKAIEELEAIIKADPAKVYAYEMLGKIFEEEKEYERAIRNYEQVLLLTPNQPAAYQRMAEIFAVQLKNPDKAVEVLAEARRRFSDLPVFSYMLARTLTIAKRYDEALSMFDQTAAEAEQMQDQMLNGGFYFDWGATAEQAGRIEKATELLRKSLKLEDQPERVAQTANYLGYMWVDRSENLEEAGQLIQRALQIAPNNGAYLDSLGWYYYRAGKFDKALTELLRAVENTDPPDATVFDHLGDTYFKLKNDAQALNCWQKALAIEPGSEKISTKINDYKAKHATASAASTPAAPATKKE